MPSLAIAMRETEAAEDESAFIDSLGVDQAVSVVRTAPDDLLSMEKEVFDLDMKCKRRRSELLQGYAQIKPNIDAQTWLDVDSELALLTACHFTKKVRADYLRRTYESAQLILTVFAQTRKGN